MINDSDDEPLFKLSNDASIDKEGWKWAKPILALAAAFVLFGLYWNAHEKALRGDLAVLALDKIFNAASSLDAVSLDYKALEKEPKSIYPVEILDPQGTLSKSPWGGAILAEPEDKERADSFTVSFFETPKTECAVLVAKGHGRFAKVLVNGQEVWKKGEPAPNQNPAELLCEDTNRIDFVSSTKSISFGLNPIAAPKNLN